MEVATRVDRWFVALTYIALWSARIGAVAASVGAAITAYYGPLWQMALFTIAVLVFIVASVPPEEAIKQWRLSASKED